MPTTQVVFFADHEGCPVLEWLDGLPKRIQAKARVRIERLAEIGHELRRPEADYLRDGVYELRWRFQSVNYRILYFFHGRDVIVLSNGLTKEDRVPS
ncbi:MAG TPA: type II toxin-antitoxin system RelE/ParE family toxin [Nitrospiria bacterium]|nr:type II toxin-antitoxin system RelE/ParE family toxin [Nitrospiria bacterium]